MTRRVKITKLPEAGYGRPISEGWTTRYKNGFTGGMFDNKGEGVRKTLTSVPREDANVEAEGGETVVGDFQKDGLDEFYNIEGPRHADGPGVPLKLPESFIFSDTRKMRINDPSLLKIFGKGKGSYTPAALSKQYQLNDYNAKLTDKDVDPLEKETAELMINNNRDKLSKLAIIQEVYLKGGNVPEFAYPYLKKKGIDTTQLATDQDDINEEQYRYGGYLPKAQNAGQKYDTWDSAVEEAAKQKNLEYIRNPWQKQEGIGSQKTITGQYRRLPNGMLVDKTTGQPVTTPEFFKTHPAAMENNLWDTYQGGFEGWQRDLADPNNRKRAGMAWVEAANKYGQKYAGKDIIATDQPDYWEPGLEFTSVGTFASKTPGGEGSGAAMPRTTPCGPDQYLDPVTGLCANKKPEVEENWEDWYQGDESQGFPVPAKIQEEKKREEQKEEEKQTYDYSQYPSQPFFKSDVVDLYGSAFSLFDNVDIPPTYQRTAAARTINPVLEDPTRAIANRQEGAARQTDAIKAFGRNPSAASSYMQGLAAGDTANIISGVNQRNIGTLNQAQGFNAQMLTNYDRARQMADRQYDVDLATYLQQKANTKAQKRNVFRDKLSQAYTNQADINQINAQEPSYYFDTRLNNTVFTGRPGNESGSSTYTGMPENFRQLPEEERQAYLDEAQLKYQLQRNAFGSNRWGSRFNRNTRR